MTRLGAVVLAAGLSSRMGAFKPLLPIGGGTMVKRVVAVMRAAGARPVVVVTGYRGEDVQAHLQDTGVEFVHNAAYARTQMLDSLLVGFSALQGRCERILVSPSDMPVVREETVKRLLALDGQFVRPLFEGKGGHPVVLEAEIIPVLQGYRGEGGLRGAVESAGIELVELPVRDQGVIMDCDTPENYREMLRYDARSARE